MTNRRNLLTAVASISLLAALPAWAQDARRIPVAAAAASVLIHPDQAAVTRVGSAEVPAGDSLLVLSGIPAGVLPDSLNARGRATGRVAIGAVEMRQATFDPGDANRRRAEIEARVRDLDDRMAEIDVRVAGFSAQQALVERLSGGFAEAQRRPQVPAASPAPRLAEDPATWRSAFEAVRDGTQDAAEGLRKARLERRGLEEAKARLQAEIATLGVRQGGTLEIAVAVRAESATTLELSVTYQVRGAAWRPVYEARLDSATGRLALRQEAVVTQRTGEDWTDVAIRLSTSRPSAGVQSAQMSPLRIGLAPTAEERGRQNSLAFAVAPAPASAAFESASGGAGPASARAVQPVEADHQLAAASVRGLAVEFEIPGRATIRSDGTERRVRIADLSAEATLSARAVPKIDARAFLLARFPSPARVPSLPGQASLYLDGVFVGRAAMPLTRPDEPVTLPFGADDRVSVTYEPQEQKRSTDFGLRSGRTTSEAREALIVVRNLHVGPFEITVLDQAPVSTDENLTVVVTAEPQPTARDIDDKPGVLAWTATYRPGEERRIRFGYSVTSPRDRVVTGLPR